MTTIEVLAPLRLETRFLAPADRTDGGAGWLLRLRVYPDEFSIRRVVAPPSPAELDRLTDAVASMPGVDEAAAFASFASSVGAARALGLWRRWVAAGAVDRSGQVEPDHHVAVHGPAGLPEQLQVWFVHTDGTRELAAGLAPDLAAIGADLDIESFAGSAELAAGTLPETWWLSYRRAQDVGLGVDIELGAAPPDLAALVVLGVGETDAADLVDAHNAASRLAVLAPGTSTNTVHGEPTTDFGDHADSLYPLLHLDPNVQQSARVVLEALTGRVAPDALPLLGGDLDYFGPGSLAVQGFWPALWGRALRDVITTQGQETQVARWAIRNLAVEGPRPAIRVGEQPYGLLPTSAFTAWQGDPADPLTPVEDEIRRWGLAWRTGAATSTEAAHAWVDGAGTDQLLDVLGRHAPNRHWRARPVADAAQVQAARILAGVPPLPVTDWDVGAAQVWRQWPYPAFPIVPAARSVPLPGPPEDAVEDVGRLKALLTLPPEPLYFRGQPPLGLVGHLVRESLIAARAVVGDAVIQWRNTGRVDAEVPLPVDEENEYRALVLQGSDEALAELRAADAGGQLVAARYDEVFQALEVIVDLWAAVPDALFRATLAALDAAAFRVDPWLTGLAERRLQTMLAAAAPVQLGAYGWVDAPAPFAGSSALAPGPTAAGLLHAPSRDQALIAALLRDAAIRHPTDGRWDLTVDSAKVRASIALAERVRLGSHPYEALGLEVERVAGDWDSVRTLRQNYPLAPDQDARRVCDGPAVLAAARAGTLVAGLALDLAARLAPLDDVLDTYADLLLADGVHALVTGNADLGNAAMEAAAGLGAPPELRAVRTPRAATTVRVAAWLLLPTGTAPASTIDTSPAAAADPAFTALATAEGATTVEARARLAVVVGGGEAQAPVPSLIGGAYEGLPATADDDLHAAIVADLDARLVTVTALANLVRDTVAGLDPADPVITAVAARWHVDLTASDLDTAADADADADATRQAAVLAALADRLAAPALAPAVKTDDAVNLRRAAVRALVGDATLPVLPVVATTLLPTRRAAPDLDERWLEIVAAVRPRLAPLEAHQFAAPWPAALAGSSDPWSPDGPILAVYGPAAEAGGPVAVAALDAWSDSIPSSRHATSATFGFNSPKSRAPQAVLLAVPPDLTQRLTNEGLLDVVLETRELAHARAAQPGDRGGLPYATPSPLVHAVPEINFLNGWPT